MAVVADVVQLSSRVPPQMHGATLLDYLCRRFRYFDRDGWQRELDRGRIEVDGVTAGADLVMRGGTAVVYNKPHQEPPIDRDVRILYRDSDIVVVDKPAHLPMHSDGPFLRHTLIFLLRSEHGLAGATLVHRLDRETSGVVVVAQNRDARRKLDEQFAAGTVGKHYLAVVHGSPPDTFRCDAAIGHAATSEVALRRSAAADARATKTASTAFETLERAGARSLVRCVPGSGRTHQIRVHLEHLGHPIVGDKLYGRPDADYLGFVHAVKAGADPRQETDTAPSRQLLHATELQFRHPTSGAVVAFTSPAPPEFRRWLLAP